MTKLRTRLGALICALILMAAGAPVSITGQLLAYQDGFVFLTTGDGFRLAPSVTILDEKTKAPAKREPRARDYARITFNDAGQVVEIDLSDKPYPVGPLPEVVAQYAITASTPYPNPELEGPPPTTSNGVAKTYTGKLVLVKFEVQVPPTTPISAQIYIATDVSDWNPQAIQMDRIDALHFVAIRRMASGTIIHYLYTRGSLQTEERGPNGLSLRPRELVVNDSDTNSTNSVVASWADSNANGLLDQPSVFPTPYNPNPFPNLPRGVRTPQPQ
ncbi:MAG TPA: hypothetical protein VMA98_12710 [Candidatus Acidoferrales bacterium]|nr:hypothetical protein [Candidatus Acidoferrales bacterium]